MNILIIIFDLLDEAEATGSPSSKMIWRTRSILRLIFDQKDFYRSYITKKSILQKLLKIFSFSDFHDFSEFCCRILFKILLGTLTAWNLIRNVISMEL